MTSTTRATAYRWGHLDASAVPSWAALTTLLAEVDDTEETYEPEDLAEELEEHGFTPERDSWAVWDGDALVGYGQVRVGMLLDHEGRVRSFLGGGVHPGHRCRGLGTALMDRMEQRARELAAERHPGQELYWRASGGLEGSSARELLERRGYRVVRWFSLLSRPLPGEPVAAPDPESLGVRLVSPGEEHEEATRLAQNEAFRDHWGSAPITAEAWHDHWASRASRPALSTLALDTQDRVLAYVLCGQWSPGELHVTLVGTVREARGRGLAAACLARTIALAADAGEHRVIELEVDSESPTGATRLYERVGFAQRKQFASMSKDAGRVGA